MKTLRTSLNIGFRFLLLPVYLTLDIAQLLDHELLSGTHFGEQMRKIELELDKLTL